MLLEDRKSSVATSLSVHKDVGTVRESIVHGEKENSVEATSRKFLHTCNASSTNTVCGDMLEC